MQQVLENTTKSVDCRLCGAPNLVLVLELSSAPRSVERLLLSDGLSDDGPCSLEVYQCRNCGLVQLVRSMAADFYDDYAMATSFSPSFHVYLEELADMFCATFGAARGRLLEIGCGDGTFLSYLSKQGFDVYGLEPSKPFRDAARGKDLKVFGSYLGQDSPAPDSPYDAFVTRQVLEHVFDISGFLRGIHMSVSPGAPGLLEVPNLCKSVTDGRFYDFFPDHVNYFSPQTLRRALEISGFDVIDVVPTMNDEYIAAFVKRSKLTDMLPVRSAVDAIRTSLAQFVEDHRQAGKRLAIWGSGGKGVAALAAVGWEGVSYVVDTDPRKQGLFMPVHLQVFAPERLKTEHVDTVLVTALAHLNEISVQLRKELNFEGRIAVLGTSIDFVY